MTTLLVLRVACAVVGEDNAATSVRQIAPIRIRTKVDMFATLCRDGRPVVMKVLELFW